MRIPAMTGVLAVLVLAASAVNAADIKSGLQVGDPIVTYTGEKCGGIVDGIAVGRNLCYTWVLGSRPVVFIFARKMDDNLASLVKQLDKIVGANKGKKAASVVNFLGEETDDVITSAKKFGKQHKVKNIALVVPRPSFNGPPSFKVSEQAELTVMLYKGRRIVSNHAVAAGKLDKKKVDAIVKDATGLFK